MPEVTVSVQDMRCSQCARAVSRQVTALEGVRMVAVDVAAGTVRVVGEVDADTVMAAVRAAGFHPSGRENR